MVGQKGRKVIVVAADCTGHGVPAALLSILGISLLDKVVNQLNIVQSDEILDKLREEIVKVLHQTDDFDKIKDGMDLSLLVINQKDLSAQYSGAYNSMIKVNKKLVEYEADKMPIAIPIHPERDKSFNKHIIKLEANDMIYLFSDGFIHQFSEETNKKYSKKNFKELLYKISKYKLDKQKAMIDNEFKKWKGKNEQVDDILILGIRV